MSDVHATLRLAEGGYTLVDNDSTNGTRINGTRLAPGRSKRLKDGDVIEVGAYRLAFQASVALTASVTAERTAELARRLFRGSQAGARVAGPRLVVVSGPASGASLEVPPPPSRLLVGRGADCQLVLDDTTVAAEHAEVIRDLDGVLIRIAAAGAAIGVNGQPATQRRLRDGDELVLGATKLLFEEPAEEPIDNLGGEPDRGLPPEPAPASEPGRATTAAPDAAQVPAAPAPRARPSRSQSFDADVIIYTLAAIVIAASVAALIALISAD